MCPNVSHISWKIYSEGGSRLCQLASAKAQHYWLPPVPSATAPEKPWCKIIARYRRAVRGGAAARPQACAACRGRADFNNKVFQNAELKDSGKSVVQFVARCELISFPLQIRPAALAVALIRLLSDCTLNSFSKFKRSHTIKEMSNQRFIN